MKLVRLGDISIAFSDDESFVLRSFSRGVATRVPGPALALLSFCVQPRSVQDVIEAFGPAYGQLFEALHRAGFLATPEEAAHTPMFFENYASVDVHRRMLADRVRLDAYKAALQEVVKPGMAVLDAGTGSGILACLAAQAGARVVYAVDRSDMVDLARNIVAESGLDETIQVVRGDFARVELPEKVDVIVSETFGQFALAEGAGPDLVQTARRHLKEGGRVVPDGLELYVAPVRAPTFYAETVDPFDDTYGVQLGPLADAAMRRARNVEMPASALIHPGKCIVTMPWPDASHPQGEVTFEDLPAGAMHGWVGWFDIQLSPSVRLSTSPTAPMTHWKQTYFPMPQMTLSEGTRWTHRMTCKPSPGDRRGYEVTSDWSRTCEAGMEAGSTMHRVR